MAKSLRSKWRRKCRAVKRERYGAKELEKLKKTLGITENAPIDAEMKDISEIATIVDAKTLKDKANESQEMVDETEKMDVGNTNARVYNKKTMLDQYGNYPPWFNRRKIEKCKKGRAKSKKGVTKSNKRLTRKQKKALSAKE
ncbi:protein LLP homolog [Prorops nasuta]|uniref:protein LLP homolog n=1 Tax=Prorops nasuta TaxID=863751 RepID=UPI0034CEF791